jgi:hypothetical protein
VSEANRVRAIYTDPTPEPSAVFVVGPTASGKTALALTLARRFDGEIVNADSRAFYRGMDIGTAKPTPGERADARHHLIDVVDPDEVCSLGWFLERARAALAGIAARGRRRWSSAAPASTCAPSRRAGTPRTSRPIRSSGRCLRAASQLRGWRLSSRSCASPTHRPPPALT